MGQPEPHLRATDVIKAMCQKLLRTKQSVPKDSLFEDDLWRYSKPEWGQSQQGHRSVDRSSSRRMGSSWCQHLKHWIEKFDESWIKSIPRVNCPRPQPDFSPVLESSAFTSDPLKKLKPFVGDWRSTSRVVATDYMYSPFLTSEVNTATGHSTSPIGRTLLDQRCSERHCRALQSCVLSRRARPQNTRLPVLHDHRVRIYGHYVLIKGKDSSIAIWFVIAASQGSIFPFDQNIVAVDSHSPIIIRDWKGECFFVKIVLTGHRSVKLGKDNGHSSSQGTSRHISSNSPRKALCRCWPAAISRSLPCAAASQHPNTESFEQDDRQLAPSYSQESVPRVPSSQTADPVFNKPKGKGARELGLPWGWREMTAFSTQFRRSRNRRVSSYRSGSRSKPESD